MPIPFKPQPEPYYITDDISCRVYKGDCREVLTTLKGIRYSFIFADPPFNIGQEYRGFIDNMTREDYAKFTEEWLNRCYFALVPDGVLCLHGPDELTVLYLKIVEQWAGIRRIAWINWHYRFGQCTRSNWIDSRCHCLIYAKSPFNYTWNPESVLVDSDRKTQYNDKRIHETERGGQRLPGTVWGIPSDGPYWGRVQGNSEERRPNHPNQLPEVYLERLIKAYTNPGDRILDPFGGSGTTVTVAAALGRKCDTIEISEQSCQSLVSRLRKGAVRVR